MNANPTTNTNAPQGFTPMATPAIANLRDQLQRSEVKVGRRVTIDYSNMTSGTILMKEILQLALEENRAVQKARKAEAGKRAWRKTLREAWMDIVTPCTPGGFIPENKQIICLVGGKSYEGTIADLPKTIRAQVIRVLQMARDAYWEAYRTLPA